MRPLVGIFGCVCSAVVVVLVARFAFKSADNDIDGAISAFLYATIAAGGLGGHAVAVRVWTRDRAWGAVIGFVAAAALIVNVSNSLGAIAVRGDLKTAERLKQAQANRDLRAEFERLSRERAALPAFRVTSADAVNAAREDVEVAAKRATADCERRSSACRALQATEQEKRTLLRKALSDRSSTERAETLDADIAQVRAEIAKVRPVQAIDPQATALSRLAGTADAEMGTLITVQYLAVSVIVELLIVAALVGYELLDDAPRSASASVQTAAPAVGDIASFALERLTPAPETDVALDAVHRDYAAWCANQVVMPMTQEQVERWFKTVGGQVGLALAVRDDRLLCLGVRLAT